MKAHHSDRAIGEASNHVSPDIRARYAHIPWRDIVNMRHHLSHGYFQVAVKDVWDTVDNDLSPLQKTLLIMLEDTTIR